MENDLNYQARGSSEPTSVRTALKNLPKVPCPTGFEYRLAKRLESSGSRTENRWYLSWAGAGLGFAAVIVFFIFTFDFNSAPTGGMTQTESQPNSAIQVNPVMDEPPAQVATQTPSETSPDVQADETPAQLAATPKDSSQRAKLPEGHYETVGGQPTKGNGP